MPHVTNSQHGSLARQGAWRWFSEAQLDCCVPLDVVKRDGTTLAQIACLARCNGARVDMRRTNTFTPGE